MDNQIDKFQKVIINGIKIILNAKMLFFMKIQGIFGILQIQKNLKNKFCNALQNLIYDFIFT